MITTKQHLQRATMCLTTILTLLFVLCFHAHTFAEHIEFPETGLMLAQNNTYPPQTPPPDTALYTPTHLPIDISAIRHGEQPNITLSLRFFDLDLFSTNSQRINEAMAEQLRLNRKRLGDSLFESFETVRIMDVNEQVAYIALNMGLFTEPASFGRIGQADIADEIPIWVIILLLPVCAVLGYVIARAVGLKSEGKA